MEDHANSKVSTAALWAEPPNLTFPQFFIEVLDLDEMLTYINEKIEIVKDRISKRIEEESKKRYEKQQQAQKEQDNLAE